jgi:hypothetical protein
MQVAEVTMRVEGSFKIVRVVYICPGLDLQYSVAMLSLVIGTVAEWLAAISGSVSAVLPLTDTPTEWISAAASCAIAVAAFLPHIKKPLYGRF